MATTAGNWNNTANWSVATGGPGGASVPGVGDLAVFTSDGNGNCSLTANQTVGAISISTYTGVIDLKGFTLTVSDATLASYFSTGTFSNTGAAGSLAFSGAGAAVFNGMTMNAKITGNLLGVNFNGSIFNGTVTLTKNGTTSDTHTGGNIFNNGLTFVNNSSGIETFANTSGDSFIGTADVILTNSGAGGIFMSSKGTNSYNGNIYVNSTNGVGIFFGSGGGTSSLNTGKTISVGGTGFSAGELRLLRFSVSALINISLTGTASLRIGTGTSINGLNTWVAPSIYLDGATFISGATFTKTGSSNDVCIGGNNFSSGITFTNSGTGSFRFAGTVGDNVGASATFTQSPGIIEPAYNGTNVFSGSIIVNSSTPIVFGAGTGVVSLQHISSGWDFQSLGTAAPTFNRLQIATSAGVTLYLQAVVNVAISVTFTTGILNSVGSNYLNIANGATVSGASNSSHVDGKVRKTGNQAFTFPVGNGGIYRPITITAPSAATDAFTAQFIHSAQTSGNQSTYQLPILTVSSCEYWILDRSMGTSNVSVTLGWNSSDCTGTYITDLTKLVVGRWNGTNWVSQGNGGTTGTTASGTITSSGAVTSFSPFAIASSSLANPLPITLNYFTATLVDGVANLAWETESEIDNDFFTLERSADGVTFDKVTTVKGAGTKHSTSKYEYADEAPLSGISYYRLKQTDFDKTEHVLRIATIENKGGFAVYPNPVSSADHVRTNFSGPAQILNGWGQVVMEVANASAMIIQNLTPGLYIVRAANGQTSRLIVK